MSKTTEKVYVLESVALDLAGRVAALELRLAEFGDPPDLGERLVVELLGPKHSDDNATLARRYRSLADEFRLSQNETCVVSVSEIRHTRIATYV